ncbi:purine-nucleoside phosphorylase [Lacrimispora sp. BS-2]|uniref:Purine nucleoside phosphorylase DeoD-type n=1 Tax=Lacrimispora sp. BS-2 TaxID=3151850 RepID=A0AAU7PUL3_9FIRM
MGTPHNGAEKGDIAKTVLMPGDPLRAKFIAETYLDDVVCFNTVRNMFGYTGTYKGKRISVMGGGMGMPSIGIYSYELFNHYDVDQIMRIGSAGAISDRIKVRDIIIAMGACTDSNYAYQYGLKGTFAPIGDYRLLERAVKEAECLGITPVVGNVLSSDVFYNADPWVNNSWAKMGVMAVEMESAALYMNAARAGKKALCILTVSDHILQGLSISPEERQTGFSRMMELALNTAAGVE